MKTAARKLQVPGLRLLSEAGNRLAVVCDLPYLATTAYSLLSFKTSFLTLFSLGTSLNF